ncbi:Anthranilate synthase component 1 [Rosistilla ulvae]|uniref:Anthranilate synthase component 1 n=1 Tax=Rosistilla ulvae TaxID=1930277 RepID=A0A517LTX1_9BACT|nr:anthranilate synthase component I [Rosistilla ulvae]QDS86056.1 Anthranilate synthase component 1 [Rosistilla ulvae]
MHTPNEDQFTHLASTHDLVPVSRRLLSDSLTPVSAFRLLDNGRSACLFESVIGGEKVGRFSFLAVDPIMRFCAHGQSVSITRGDACETKTCDDPLDEFRGHLAGVTFADTGDLPPFVGGAIGYAGYDVVRYVENLPNAPEDDRQLPDLDFGFYHTLVVFDNVTKTMTIVAVARPADFDSPAEAYRDAKQRIDETVAQLSRPVPHLETADVEQSHDEQLDISSNFTREGFADAVEKCREYIRAGDIFQVVPSQRFAVDTSVDPFEIYRSLRVVNPSPFMFYMRTPECTLIGCSPEIMTRVVDGVVTVRPLAGTRRRGATEQEDLALEEELLSDPKERAEHVMLVDLGRNDIGRIAKFGTVELTEVMVVERYSHVMHISSEVRGELRDGLDAFDALKACLPAGTVSGAPKVRAMEVIDELEPHRRGPYGGAVGYIDYRGNMDTCIALRTMVVQNDKVYVQAGCGVVADSNPDAEYEETVNKAKGMVRAISLTLSRLNANKRNS